MADFIIASFGAFGNFGAFVNLLKSKAFGVLKEGALGEANFGVEILKRGRLVSFVLVFGSAIEGSFANFGVPAILMKFT
jgi:hypothetical protein